MLNKGGVFEGPKPQQKLFSLSSSSCVRQREALGWNNQLANEYSIHLFETVRNRFDGSKHWCHPNTAGVVAGDAMSWHLLRLYSAFWNTLTVRQNVCQTFQVNFFVACLLMGLQYVRNLKRNCDKHFTTREKTVAPVCWVEAKPLLITWWHNLWLPAFLA